MHHKPPNQIKPLNQELADAISDASDFDGLLKVLLKAKDKPRRKMHPEFIGHSVEYATTLFYPVSDFEDCLKAFARVLEQDRNSPEAYHFIGYILMANDIYFQAHVLFDRGLGLKVPEVESKEQDNLHIRIHFDLCDLIGWTKYDYPDIPISAYGFPTEKMPWIDFDNKFLLPDYNLHEVELTDPKEIILNRLHYTLAGMRFIDEAPHTSENCPYLDYINARLK